jgi:haloalkane dehalogenase
VIDALATRHRCIAPDLPGYGATGATFALPPGWRYTRDAQIGFVDELLAALGLGDVTLVVHDIGGIMGVPWAARNPGRLRGVVYTNTVAYPDWQWFPLARMWGSRRLRDRARTAIMMRSLGARRGRYFMARFGAAHPRLDAAQLRRFADDFAGNPIAKATTVAQFRLLVEPGYFAGYDAMLRSIAAATPTRAVWGLGDPYVPDERAPQLLAAELDRIPDAGHWVPLIAPAEVAGAIAAVASESLRATGTVAPV